MITLVLHPTAHPVRSRAIVPAAGLISLVVLLHPHPTCAVGFRLPNQDPEAIARGNAFVATADNPSAIYYNPAGIAQLDGQNLRVGLYLVSAGTEYESASGATADVDSRFQPVPQIYYVNRPDNNALTFGLGLYAPYGLSLDWGRNTPFNTLAEEGKLVYLSFNPVVAWQVHRTLSIGVGLTINHSEAEFKQGVGFSPGDQFRVEGDDSDFGLNAGILWQPHEKWSFGANYRSATTLDYQGTSQTTPSAPPPIYFASTPTRAMIEFPQFVVMGVSFRPTTNWNVEFNADWTDWDTLDQIVFRGTPYPIALVLNYESSWMYEFGVTRLLPRHWFVSVGYFYSENSSPDAGFNPIIPDTDLHLGSIGFGHKGRRWDFALAYHFGYNSGRTVSGSPTSFSGQSADGEYRVLNHAINLAGSLRF